MTLIIYLVVFILLLLVDIVVSENLLSSEVIPQYDSKETRFVIKEKLLKIYNFELEVYVSLIEQNITNHIKFQNLSDSEFNKKYSDNYHDLFGGANSFFPLQDMFIYPTVHNVTNNSTPSYTNKSEVLLDVVYLEQKSLSIKILTMRNLFFHHLKTCNFTKLRDTQFLSFYDLNLIYKDDDCVLPNTQVNLLQINMNYKDYLKLNEYSNILAQTNIQRKIERKGIINKLLNEIILSKEVINFGKVRNLTLILITISFSAK